MLWVYDDGGRAAAGYRGTAGDCVTRAIAIAAERDYQEVYDGLFEASRAWGAARRGRTAQAIQRRGASPRSGVHKRVIRAYMDDLGWVWTPTMAIGSGTTNHLRAEELPSGRLVVSCSRHLVAVIDGVAHDTHDPRRGGTRCVYGYWEAPALIS